MEFYQENLKKNLANKIPIVKPEQFDNFLFGDWKAPNYNFYDKFHIERIETYKEYLHLPTAPHRRSVNFFVFLTQGKIVRSKGLNQYQLEANDFFCLSANQITAIESISNDIQGYYCHFESDIFNQPFLKSDLLQDFPLFQLSSEPLIKLQDTKRIIKVLDIILEENQGNNSARFALVPLYLLALFTEIKNEITTTQPALHNAAAQLTQRYKNALTGFIYEKKTVQEFADHLAVTPNHLNKCVKNTTGKSAHELLDEMRILEAKVLLKQSTLSISEIAFKIAKFDPSDFSRFFKLHTNLSPKQYRLGIFD